MSIVRFPLRRIGSILIVRERGGGWLVLAGSHGLLHGDRRTALADPHWLAWNLELPVRAAL
jgi:hypothetical protein